MIRYHHDGEKQEATTMIVSDRLECISSQKLCMQGLGMDV